MLDVMESLVERVVYENQAREGLTNLLKLGERVRSFWSSTLSSALSRLSRLSFFLSMMPPVKRDSIAPNRATEPILKEIAGFSTASFIISYELVPNLF